MKEIEKELDNFELSNLEVEEMVDAIREIINRQDEFIFYKYGEDCMSFKYTLFIDMMYNLHYSYGFEREQFLKDINDHFDMMEKHNEKQKEVSVNKEQEFLEKLKEINEEFKGQK